MKKIEEETSDTHHSSTAISLISTDIARRTRLSRLYVAFCMIFCVGLFGLLVAKMFLFK